MKRSRRYVELAQKVNKDEALPLEQAVGLVKELATAKFDETVEFATNLGVDPKHADQIVRGTVVLPHGTGRKTTVLVIAEGDKAKDAEKAGADYVGSDEYIEKIQGGWTDVDVIITTPNMMGKLGRLGRILGPRGLMPNPKSGTVTMDIEKAVKEAKAGKVEYRTDKKGNIHVAVGKVSFAPENLVENIKVVMAAIIKDKPAVAKGTYVKNVVLSSTMGPGVKVEISSIASV